MSGIISKKKLKKDVRAEVKKTDLADLNTKGPGNLKKHFGKLKLGIDGLKFQKKVRREWD